MKKRYWIALIIAICAAIGIAAQGGFNSGAYFVNPTTLGNIPMCNQFVGGLCVYSPSGLVDNGTTLYYKNTPVALASNSQNVTITALAGIDPTHGGSAVCWSGTTCNSTSGIVLVTWGTTPVDGDVFSIGWASAKGQFPVTTFTNSRSTTTTWADGEVTVLQDVDTSSTMLAIAWFESGTFGLTSGATALEAYQISPSLP